MTRAEIIRKIEEAAAKFDRDGARAAVEELVTYVNNSDASLSERDARDVLSVLQRKRFFDLTELAADAIIQNGQVAPRVRRYYAQALIDQGRGRLAAAVTALEKLIGETGSDPEKHAAALREFEAASRDLQENVEARGLLGRALKQQYINAAAPGVDRNQEILRKAVEAYHSVYREDNRHRWHGINTVALVRRARRDQVRLSNSPDVEALAADLLRDVWKEGAAASAWDLATAVEASVAVHDREQAIRWASGYAAHPGADAFELGSTLRQLTEVWGLDTDDEIGAPVLAILRNGLLQRENGYFVLTGREIREALNPEKVFGAEKYVSLYWYRNGLARARMVARVGREPKRPDGTGFLVWGRTLADRLGDEWYLLTNEHVISENIENRVPQPVHPQQAMISFEVLETEKGVGEQVYRVKDLVATSPFGKLDFTLVSLDRPVAGVSREDAYEVAPVRPTRVKEDRLFIIGHPNAGTLSLSLHDNVLLEFNDTLLQYRTPTDPGSSGSPVFNDQWQLVGLHHAGLDKMRRLEAPQERHEANEGIWIDAIRAHLATAA